MSNWEYDAYNRNCKIYDKDGNILDQLDLDEIVRKYIRFLTEADSVETPTDYKLEENVNSLKMKESSN